MKKNKEPKVPCRRERERISEREETERERGNKEWSDRRLKREEINNYNKNETKFVDP